jgi:hypothetical protein
MSDYDDTNKGALFEAANQKVIRSGPMNFAGEDGKMAIIQTTTKHGKTVFEVYQKLGAVFPNEKRDENDADMTGKLNLNGVEFRIWGRKKVSKNNQSFTSISIAPKINGGVAKQSATIGQSVPDDEIPF